MADKRKASRSNDSAITTLFQKTTEDDDSVQPILQDGSGNLNVNVQAGGTAGAQYNDGDSFTSSTKGTLALGTDGSNVQALSCATDGKLNTNPYNYFTKLSVSGSAAATLTTLVTAVTSTFSRVTAFSITTTSATDLVVAFLDGSNNRLWEVLLLAPSGGFAGANLATTGPDYLFTTPANSALTLSCSSGLSVNYSISYFKET
jgi:hypothetical protein